MNTKFTFRRVPLLIAFLLLAVAVTGETYAQTIDDALRFSQRFPSTGARMTGMAGAGNITGIADYAALFGNPAGLGYFQKSMVAGSFYTISSADESFFQVPNFSNPLNHDIRNTGLGNLAYIAKAPTTRGSLVFGASYNQINSFTRELMFSGENANNSITDYFMPLPGEFEIRSENGDYVPHFFRDLSFIAYQTFAIDIEPSLLDAYLNNEIDNPFLPAVTRGVVGQQGRVSEDGSMKEVNFGAAVEAAQNVMAGLSVNLSFGSYDFSRVFEETDIQNANDGISEDANGILTVPFDQLNFIETFNSDLVGVNARAGISTQLPMGLRLGLLLETPTYFSVSEDYSTMLDVFFDNGEFYSYGTEFEDDAGTGSYEYEILTPWRFGAGLAYTMSGLTASLEAEFVDWSQLELDSNDDPAYFDQLNRDIRDFYQGVVNTRIGIEYQIGGLLLRTGLAIQPDPRDYDLFSVEDPGIDRTRTFFAAGVGYRFANQFQIDFGWMQERFEDQYLPYTEVDGAPWVDEEIVRNRVSAGIRVFF